MRLPDWADANRHDPGMTLLGLFAWLALGLLVFRQLARHRRSGRRRP